MVEPKRRCGKCRGDTDKIVDVAVGDVLFMTMNMTYGIGHSLTSHGPPAKSKRDGYINKHLSVPEEGEEGPI